MEVTWALGIAGVFLALMGVAWAANRDGLAAVGSSRATTPRPSSPVPPFRLGLLCLGGFVSVYLAIQMPSIERFDLAAVLRFYRCGGPSISHCMRLISNTGGGDLVRYGVPLALAACYFLGRAQSLRFLFAATFGTVGLEAFLKALIHRARPDLGHGSYFDSYPSGHALAVTILAGTLLVIWLPGCRWRWQRGLLWISAVAWPASMSAARVYLGCHYVTDVVGGLLLGAAWVCFCRALLLALVRAEPEVPEMVAAPLSGT